MDIKVFTSVFLAFLALVNPLQKLFVIMSLQESYNKDELRKIINRSNITALSILILFLLVGEIILNYVFNLQIYAFQVTCGFVLFYNGLMGLQKGVFLSFNGLKRIEDVIAVPIAVPMIAGPAAITAAVTMPAIYGKSMVFGAVLLAIAVNWIVMRYAEPIARLLNKRNILMPLIRITGLIVAAIGTQMIFNGIMTFIHQIKNLLTFGFQL